MFFNFRLKNPRRNVALIRSKNNVALDDGKIAKKSRRRGSPERKTRKRPIRPHIRACYIIFRFCRFVKEGIRPFSPKFPKIFQKKQNFLARRRLSEKSSTKNATRLFPKSKTCQKSNNQRFGASGEKNFKKKSKTVKKSLQSRRGGVTIAYVSGGKIVFFDAFAPRGFFRRPPRLLSVFVYFFDFHRARPPSVHRPLRASQPQTLFSIASKKFSRLAEL